MPHLLLDAEHSIVGAFVGWPLDDGWGAICDDTIATLKSAVSKMKFKPKEIKHRCRHYPSVAHSLSFRGGQEVRPTPALPYMQAKQPPILGVWLSPTQRKREGCHTK